MFQKGKSPPLALYGNFDLFPGEVADDHVVHLFRAMYLDLIARHPAYI